jgi:hypothetical protein
MTRRSNGRNIRIGPRLSNLPNENDQQMRVCWYRSKQTDDKSINFLDVGIAHVHACISTNLIIMIALTGLAVHCVAESLTRCLSIGER